MSRTWLDFTKRAVLPSLLLVVGAALGGCSKDDNGGSKGSAGFVFPDVPTTQPTLTGMPVLIDTHGGDGSAGNDGGDGGNIDVRSLTGTINHDTGRSKPSVNANFVPSAMLADNKLTYAELIAIAPAQVAIDAGNSTAFIDLNGQDFSLPSTATLDISDAPVGVDTVVIRTNGTGDVIRIDGNINGVRLTNNSVSLFLIAENCTGTAVFVSGNVDLSGYASAIPYDGGSFTAGALSGSTAVLGTVKTFGNDPSGAGGQGGMVFINSNVGDTTIGSGMLLASGGDGSNAGDGGDIQLICQNTKLARCDWGMRTAGGGGTVSSGSGGTVNVNYGGPLDAFVAYENNDGSTTAGFGPSTGGANFNALTIQGAITGISNGGNGGLGSNGNTINVFADSMFGLWLDLTSNGGAGSTTAGASGGSISIVATGVSMVNVRIDTSNKGGNGTTTGGTGGQLQVSSGGAMDNVTVTADSSGGNGGTNTGGNGGGVFIGNSVFGVGFADLEAITNSAFNVTSNGGSGIGGGNGSTNLRVFAAGSKSNDFSVNLTANGGTAPSNAGGAGGSPQIQLFDGVGAIIDAVITANGGNSGDAGTFGGGAGGRFSIASFGISGTGQSHVTLGGGPVTLLGGNGTSGGTGGVGGRVDMTLGGASELNVNNVSFTMNGGNSAGGTGGPADRSALTGEAFNCDIGGPITFNGGSIVAKGGNGSTTSGNFNGGQGGEVNIISTILTVHVGSSIDASAGTGGGTGAGGAGGQVLLVSGSIDFQVTAAVSVNGGTSTGTGNGGAGGLITIAGIAPTHVLITSALTANGANSGTGGNGGAGGEVDIGSDVEAAVHFTSTCTVHANGGTGAGTSAAGTIDIELAGSAGAGITEDTVGQLQTNNGAGTAVPANISRNP